MAETVEHQEFNENTPEADSLDLIETSQNVNIENTNTIENVVEEEKEVEEKEAGEKLFRFPLGTIKRIVKMDPDVTMTSSDGVFVISKAVELFVESLAIESYTYTANSKKKTISRQDVEKAIDAVDALAFLDGAMDD